MDVITIETPSLGDRSYLVHDGSLALVVDPQRDIGRVEQAAAEAGVRIALVVETHVHNDYVSGGLVLSRVTGARYAHAAAEDLAFEHEGLSDGDRLEVGGLTVEVVHTPGHTPHHLSYVVRHGDGPAALFTGGSMLYGTVGRTDLIDPSATGDLTRAQYRSVHRLADMAGDDAVVYPTHGFGSFCASASSDEESDGTMGGERRVNLALTADSEDAFVERLLAGLDQYPKYYAHMDPLNRAGGNVVDLSPPVEVDPPELARRIHRGEWVVDVRERRTFAHAHVSGTLNVQLADAFATYLAWTMPWAMPVTLLADDPDDIAEAQRQLARVGVDRPAGAATGGIDRWSGDADRSSYEVIEFAGLAERPDLAIVDVRLPGEYDESHVAGAINVPLGELVERLDDVPDEPVAVHCASGYRASVAASLLDRAGRDVVLIDDDFDRADAAGRGLT